MSTMETGDGMDSANATLRILLAGRGSEFMAIARTWLEQHPRVGSVVCVESGDEAVSIAAAGRIDLVLVDVTLSDIDGFETTRRIKRSAKPPLVVILVLFDYLAVRREAQLAGADACIDKSTLTQQLDPALHEYAQRIGPRSSDAQSTPSP
ncbi:MAG: response regulator [Acidobacteriota bacterium]